MTAARSRHAGMTLVEVVIVSLLLAIITASTMKAFRFISIQSVRTGDRAFAAQKALQMIEELRGMVPENASSASLLDGYDNGSAFKYTLSARPEVNGANNAVHTGDRPADPISGNTRRGTNWKFKRKVTVASIPGEEQARRVYVRVYNTVTGEQLAETMSVIRTMRNPLYPTQVYDIYVLAVENVPGWWVSLPRIRSMFGSIKTDLESRNPGLQYRVHYITRMAYGRDPYYTPAINEAVSSNATTYSGVYLYPGRIPAQGPGGGNTSTSDHYYRAGDMNGRRSIDGAAATPGYSMADQYNHAVRYPDEEAQYQQAVAATPAGQSPPEISYRMLLERLATSHRAGIPRENDLRNAMIINLHGELLPLPPMRNYSDPAKDPETYPSASVATHGYPRAVTHPEMLELPSGREMRLRVYTYCARPAAAPANARLPEMNIVVEPPLGISLAPTDVYKVRVCTGTQSGSLYSWTNATAADYDVTTLPLGKIKITLRNSYLRHQQNGTTGLAPNWRLYGLEYNPANLGGTDDFVENDRDMGDATSDVPKNTARWVISIATAAISAGRYTIETRIGGSTVTAANVLVNLSRTYTWVGNPSPPNHVPVTERYQYLGDPRFCPYADVKADDRYSHRFSTDTSPVGGWPGFSQFQGMWGWNVGIDVPRYLQTLRNALMDSNALWSSVTGWSYRYFGLGGEMGYDAPNGWANSFLVESRPWGGAGPAQTVQEITGGNGTTNNLARVISKRDNSWWARHWLGELFPDDAFTTWRNTGNLPTGAGNYYRRRQSSNIGTDNPWMYDSHKLGGDAGPAAFMNGNSTAGNANWFSHVLGDGTWGNLTAAGTVLSTTYNLPLLASFETSRPFNLDDTGAFSQPAEWALMAGERTRLEVMETWYEPTGGTYPAAQWDSSALVRMTQGTRAAGIVVNGLKQQNAAGGVQILKLSTIGLTRAFMIQGQPTLSTGTVPQVPLVVINTPMATSEYNNPTTPINVVWSSTWTRWDSTPYTAAYPNGYAGSSPLAYNVKVSADNGATWQHANSTANAVLGVYDPSYSITANNLFWNVASFPAGEYLIRVELYRTDRNLHHSHHVRRVYIKR